MAKALAGAGLMPLSRRQATGLACGLVPVVLWGLSFVATKAALGELEPGALVMARTGLAALFLGAVCAVRMRSPRLPRSALLPLAVTGVLGVFVHQLLQAHALTLTTAVRTGWLIGVIPIWSAIIAWVFLKESMRPSRAAGLGLGLLGVALLVTGGDTAVRDLLPRTRGDLLILASTVNWAVCTVLGRHLMAQVDALLATSLAMGLGGLLLLPLAGGAWDQLSAAAPVTLAAVAFLGIGCSGLAYLLWYAALERVTAAGVASLLYLEPLVTLAAGVALLGEPVEGTTIAGGLLVLSGVYVVQRRPSRE